MTTIAYDGKYVASDTLMTSDGSTTLLVHKMCEPQPGVFVWFAGTCKYKDNYIDYILGKNPNAEDELTVSFEEHCESLVVYSKPSHKKYGVWLWIGTIVIHITEPTALGSGRDLALASMYLGKSAEEAIQVASIFDSCTNDMIDLFEIATGSLVRSPVLNRFKKKKA